MKSARIAVRHPVYITMILIALVLFGLLSLGSMNVEFISGMNMPTVIVYTIYPGGNATDDFTIKANRQYKHNISVRGITANNHGKEALLDTRVDIDTEDNPYFIEMLREREHDAHFNVTPMDVYIYAGGTVTVEILPGGDGQIPDWIRMEPIHKAATKAGDGKREKTVRSRPYFRRGRRVPCGGIFPCVSYL